MALLQDPALIDCSTSLDEQFRARGSRTYQVICSQSDDEVQVRAAFQAHAAGTDLYDSHPSAPAIYAVGISVSGPPEECWTDVGTPARGNLWTVTVDYSTLEANRVPGGPLAQPLRWSMVPGIEERPAYVDYNGDPIINKAGDPFNPPLPDEQVRWRLVVTRNEAEPDFVAIRGLANKINASAWNGFDAKTVKALPVEIPEAQYDQETDETFWPMRYEFAINPETWVEKVVNQGFRELKSGKLVQINDDDGEPVNDPVLLDDDGLQLDYPADDTSIVILEFQLKETADFGDFDMDALPGLS